MAESAGMEVEVSWKEIYVLKRIAASDMGTITKLLCSLEGKNDEFIIATEKTKTVS